MKPPADSSRRLRVVAIALLGAALMGVQCGRGLDILAYFELHEAGVDRYVGRFDPVVSEDIGSGWTKHTFDPAGGDGPICIAGTPFAVFTKAGSDPDRVLIFEQGGGACWQDFYFCNVLADDAPPPLAGPHSGIWADSFDTGTEVLPNPVADYSIVYVPYCDGSVFAGDNEVIDPAFPFGPVRFHRGLRNATAAIDLAKDTFPGAKQVLLAGSSAGGVGVAGMSPFLVRFAYGNRVKLSVFNDAGPVAINLDDTAGLAARAADWRFDQFYPESCTACSPDGQATEVIKWRLDRDSTIREAFYSTDGDSTNRFFLMVPTQLAYREILVPEHDAIHALYPQRYMRFIRSGDDEHTALQRPTFYLGEADGVPLYEWTEDFLQRRPGWTDIVEDFVPLP